ENTTLDCSAHCDYLVGVYSLVRFPAKKFFYEFLNCRNSCGTSNKNNFVNFGSAKTCVFQGAYAGLLCLEDEVLYKLFELRPGKVVLEVLGSTLVGCYERKV